MNSPISANSSVVLYRRLLAYTRPYWPYMGLSVLGFVLYAAMGSAMAKLMEFFINGLNARNTEFLLWVPVLLVASRLLYGVGGFLGNFYIARVGLGVVNDLRKQLFNRLLFLPSPYYDHHNSGELISLITYNIQQVTGSVTTAVKTLLRDGLSVIGYLGYLFYHNWKLTFMLLIIAPILAAIVHLASRYFRNLSHRLQNTMGGINHIVNEAIQGFRLVRSYNGQAFEAKRFNSASDETNRLNTKYERLSAVQGPVFDIVVAIDLAIILFLIVHFWQSDVGAAVGYLTAAAMIAKPLRQLATINETIQRGLAAADTIFTVMDMPSEEDTGQQVLQVNQGRIQVENLCFSYGDSPALQGVSFTVEPGQTLALVGASGSGKSTLSQLLLRLYSTYTGRILIDGQDIRSVTLHSLRQQIGLVNQNTVLFNDSVMNNIAYGSHALLQGEALNAAAIEASARAAFAHDFIAQLPEGYHTAIGEDGARLSGGQRQRIAIARAFNKNAPILILDEATSALDNASEKAIQMALNELQQQRTTLVIAHRLSTIEQADTIIVLHQGQIVEQGTHSQLLALNGHYAHLHASQGSEAV